MEQPLLLTAGWDPADVESPELIQAAPGVVHAETQASLHKLLFRWQRVSGITQRQPGIPCLLDESQSPEGVHLLIATVEWRPLRDGQNG